MTTSKISPTLSTTRTSKLLTLSAGCFWGVERVFRKQFPVGLVDVKVGYANGIANVREVNYEKVCTGATDFVESIQIAYEPSEVTAEQLLDIFFRMHDPTTVNSQGPDVGSQYRSAILTHEEVDTALATEFKKEYQVKWYPKDKIVTIVEPIQIWYDAEDYHQQYLNKNPGGYECPSHFIRTKPKI